MHFFVVICLELLKALTQDNALEGNAVEDNVFGDNVLGDNVLGDNVLALINGMSDSPHN